MDEPQDISDALQRVLARGRETLASEEEIRAWELHQDRRDRRDRLAASGVDERLDAAGAAALLDDRMWDTRALRLVRAWIASPRPALMLLGDPGQGKTVAAAWALSRCAGRYIRANELCELRASRWRGRDRYQKHLTTELLVIDELGTEADISLAAPTLQDVIDARQRLPRRTLLLGNDLDLVARYDARTLDRLGIEGDDHGIAILRTLRGPSLRVGARAR